MAGFQHTQFEFIDHIKDPENHAFDHGIEERRMGIYRDLFFNNVKGFLSSGFPVLESIYPEEDWDTLARAFFANHECRSPYFIDISKEFVEFLSNSYTPLESDPPFLQELAHYEWLELAISVQKESFEHNYWDGESNVQSVAMSELASLVSYHYPVHQISPEYQPEEASEALYLVVYRNDDDQVNFTLLNAVSAHMLSIIQQSGQVDVEQLCQAMVDALPQLDAEQVAAGTKDTIKNMLAQQILLPQ